MRYDTIWYDMVWYICYMIWYDTIWYDMLWYDMIWYDMIWYDMIWYDTIRYDIVRYDMIYDMIFFNCNWVATRWQSCTTHSPQTKHRTSQNKQYTEQHKHFGRVRGVHCLCWFYPDVCITTEEKARKNIREIFFCSWKKTQKF